jgi:hypothetical protein
MTLAGGGTNSETQGFGKPSFRGGYGRKGNHLEPARLFRRPAAGSQKGSQRFNQKLEAAVNRSPRNS